MYYRIEHRRPYVQRGRGFAVGHSHFGRYPHIQRGRGLGNVFGSLFRMALLTLKLIGSRLLGDPIVRGVGASLKKSAVDGVANVAKDVLTGKNVKRSINENLVRARDEVAKTVNAHTTASRRGGSGGGGGGRKRPATAASAGRPPASRQKRDRWIRAPAAPVKRARKSVFVDYGDVDGGNLAE